MNKKSDKHILIIGAGIIGASIAYHFSKAGKQVTIIEASTPCSGASGASDGSVSVASKRNDIAIELANESKNYYEHLSENGNILEGVYSSRQTDFVITSELEESVINTHISKLSKYGVEVDVIKNDQLRRRYPFLSSEVKSIFKTHNEGHALAYQVVNRFLSISNINVITHCKVQEFLYSDDQKTIVGVKTTKGTYKAETVILANGLGAKHLQPQIELIANRGILIITDQLGDKTVIKNSLMFASYLIEKHQFGKPETGNSKNNALVIDPLLSGQLLIGSTRQHDDNSAKTELNVVSQILKKALRYIPALVNLDVIRVFAGVRAATPDHLPYVGPVPGKSGLWIASGFEGDGICLAPLIGREMASWILGEQPNKLLLKLSPNRFSV